MKNRYEVRGDTTVIFLTKRNGSVQECLIDTEDFDKVNKYDGTWYSILNRTNNSFYVVGNRRNKNLLRLNRAVLEVDGKCVVDHINHNTLDNRKENLRVCTRRENTFNTLKKKSNTSGYIGVVFHKSAKRWMAQIKADRKNHTKLVESKFICAIQRDVMAYELHKEYATLNFPELFAEGGLYEERFNSR